MYLHRIIDDQIHKLVKALQEFSQFRSPKHKETKIPYSIQRIYRERIWGIKICEIKEHEG